MKRIFFLIPVLLVGCVSADRDHRSVKVGKDTIEWSRDNTHVYSCRDFDISLTINSDNTNLVKNIYYGYVVDSRKSGINCILDNYYAGLIEIKNNNDRTIVVSPDRIQVAENSRKVPLVSVEELPKNIERFNPYGATKDVYNAMWFTVLIACSLQDNLIWKIAMGTDKLAHGGKERDYFSQFMHETDFVYDDLILDSNTIKPGSFKTGIVFLQKAGIHDVQKIRLSYE